jgi:rare lipoprotein A
MRVVPAARFWRRFQAVQRRRWQGAVAFCVVSLLALGCGIMRRSAELAAPVPAGVSASHREPPGQRDPFPGFAKPKLNDARGSQVKPVEVGVASWYGRQFHGKLTASGKTFDQMEMTAAHQTLPFGSRVRVTNLANGKSVEVEINDRGPFVEDRIIDLSVAAARVLDMVEAGITPVRVELLRDQSAGNGSRR